jgi:peptidyl-tRNA hydrolase, PTH1 family
MRLFVGLGNPGPEYERTRHNLGFVVIEQIARRHGFPPWRSAHQGEISVGSILGERVALLRPLTYMNESGRAVQEISHFYRIDRAVITVFHDEIELPPGKVRVKIGGGIAGHNGLRSISQYIGDEYWRVRLGIGRPDNKKLVERFVLNEFPKIEWPWVKALVETVADNIQFLVVNVSEFQNKIHLEMEDRGFGPQSLYWHHLRGPIE